MMTQHPETFLGESCRVLSQIRKCLGGCCDCFAANSFMQIFYIMASVMVGLHQLIFWLRAVPDPDVDSWVFTMFQDPPLFYGNKSEIFLLKTALTRLTHCICWDFFCVGACYVILCHWILELNNWNWWIAIVLIVVDAKFLNSCGGFNFNHSQIHSLLDDIVVQMFSEWVGWNMLKTHQHIQ